MIWHPVKEIAVQVILAMALNRFTLTEHTGVSVYGNSEAVKMTMPFVQKLKAKIFIRLKFRNVGGLVTPLVIEWTYKDGSKEIERIPAEIWRVNEVEITKVFIKDKEVVISCLIQTSNWRMLK